jgi:hypothetical protein
MTHENEPIGAAIMVTQMDGSIWVEVESLKEALSGYLRLYKSRSCGDPEMDEYLNHAADLQIGTVIGMLDAMIVVDRGGTVQGMRMFEVPDDASDLL